MLSDGKITKIYCMADYICEHCSYLFSKLLSYNRFVELEKEVLFGWFFGFKLHLIINEKGEVLNFMFTPGDVDDREPLKMEYSYANGPS